MKEAITAAHHQRIIDIKASIYPHPDRPKKRKGMSKEWIAAYEDAYRNPKGKGRATIGATAKKQMSIRIDLEVQETARRLGINLSDACQRGLELAIEQAVLSKFNKDLT